MKRSLGMVALVTLAMFGCTARPPSPASRPAPAPRKPVALLLSVEHPREVDHKYLELTTVVYRLGLDGIVTTLPISPADRSPIVPDASGSRILYSKETTDPLARELRLYDAEDGSDRLVLTGTALAYGWDGKQAVALSGRLALHGSETPFFPMGVNIPVGDLVVSTGVPGAVTTRAVAPDSKLTATVTYVGADKTSWHFVTAGGYLVAVAKRSGTASTVATWGIRRRVIRMLESEPETEGMPAVDAGVRADTFAQTGLPILFSLNTTGVPEQWLEVRRTSDWKLLRKIAPLGDVGYPYVLSSDLTRLLEPLPEHFGPNAKTTSLQEIGAQGQASRLVTLPAGFETLAPLAYVDDRYDFVYAAMPKTSGATYYQYDRNTRVSREIARLSKADLVGTEYKMSGVTQPGRFVGVEYDR